MGHVPRHRVRARVRERHRSELKPRWLIVMGDLTQDAPLLRIHSQCFTGEALGSLRCDCGDQLAMAMQAIAKEGRGLVIYEYQEGRGIGLMAKLQAYELQDVGIDTWKRIMLSGSRRIAGISALPAAILRDLGVNRVRLLTNNPRKTRALSDAGIEVVARIPCEAAPTPYSLAYLRTKKERMGHALSLRQPDSTVRSRMRAVGSLKLEAAWLAKGNVRSAW